VRPPFIFEYALFSPSAGAFYTGCAGEKWISQRPADAYTFTEEGAHRKAQTFNTGAFCLTDWAVRRLA